MIQISVIAVRLKIYLLDKHLFLPRSDCNLDKRRIGMYFVKLKSLHIILLIFVLYDIPNIPMRVPTPTVCRKRQNNGRLEDNYLNNVCFVCVILN